MSSEQGGYLVPANFVQDVYEGCLQVFTPSGYRPYAHKDGVWTGPAGTHPFVQRVRLTAGTNIADSPLLPAIGSWLPEGSLLRVKERFMQQGDSTEQGTEWFVSTWYGR